ncbi:ribosomal protein S7 [Xylona heveae TC161]|uniref:Small ribosomal subunit protein uS7m n=1 Tax=Xylona heveae (strain CBS 132557 / TC161) TaxID=1328760 RepID=A0A164ZKX9_XYLHT|nr:ribosomal protein S7 [Xylona heveae TC161]KZF19226.1 ribosomal protein S7 [Xylona heveae TC161]
MPPRLSLLPLGRPLTILSRPIAAPTARPTIALASASVRSQNLCRGFADDKKAPVDDVPPKVGPNMDHLPHVSEEAAALGRITGEGGPELEQGTPIQEILERDQDGLKKAPKVLKDQVEPPSGPKGTRSFSTSTRRSAALTTAVEDPTVVNLEGSKFGIPEFPLPTENLLKQRYDPVVKQFTNLLMWDGKLSKAQQDMSRILSIIRTAPTPSINPARPLLPSAPPPSHLPLNPVLYLTLAIDSVAPLLRIKSMKGAAGGGVALQLPNPLNLRQRRRKAITWILEAASKRKSRGSGSGQFAQRVADEVIAVMEGRSAVWDRRNALHKLAITSRANLSFYNRRR